MWIAVELDLAGRCARRYALSVCLAVPLLAGGEADSLVIRNALVADGSGGSLRRADVRIRGDRIAAVGAIPSRGVDRVLDASDLILAAGFIDVHNHSTDRFDEDPLAASQTSQGITTILLGQDGISPWPIRAYLDKRRSIPTALHALVLVGHSTVRRMVMKDDFRRQAREEEVTRMAELVVQGMREGAVGLSTNLSAEVGRFNSTDEVARLARVAARLGGVYVSHIRNEGEQVFEAVREAIAIGDRAKVPVHISHLKLGSARVWGRAQELVDVIEGARRRGVDVTADCYAHYEWWHDVPGLRPGQPASEMGAIGEKLEALEDADLILLRYPARPEYVGRSLQEIARSKSSSMADVFLEIGRDGGGRILAPIMKESDLRVLYQQPWVMFASDGSIGLWAGAPERIHIPRDTGTYPRLLSRYVRELEWLGMAEAIRRMTALPAQRLKLKDRGMIRDGAAADLVLFNPATVKDRSTWLDPSRLSEGIQKVFVNGRLVWDVGKPTGARPGRMLSR